MLTVCEWRTILKLHVNRSRALLSVGQACRSLKPPTPTQQRRNSTGLAIDSSNTIKSTAGTTLDSGCACHHTLTPSLSAGPHLGDLRVAMPSAYSNRDTTNS